MVDLLKTLPHLANRINEALPRGPEMKLDKRHVGGSNDDGAPRAPAHTGNIGILTQYYPQSWVGIPQQVAEYMAASGRQVRVVTTDPEWCELRRRAPVKIQHEPLVRWLATYTDRSKSGLKRIVNYLSYAASSTLAGGYIKCADVNYVYATQMTAGIAADVNKYLYGTPFVLHIQDVWPDSVTGSGMAGSELVSNLIGRILSPWVRYMYRRADATVGISPEMRELLIRRGSPSERTFSVYNWARPIGLGAVNDVYAQLNLGLHFDQAVTNLVYAGNMGPLQGLDILLEAMALVGGKESVHLWMVGDGVAWTDLIRQAERLDLTNVTFTGRIDPNEVREIIEAADYLIVTLKDLEIYRVNVPSKLQEALSAGKPVITNVQGAVSGIVELAEAGFTAEPNSPESLAEAIYEANKSSGIAREEMGRKALAFYEKNMASAHGLCQIEKILMGAAKHGRERKRAVG